MNSKGRYCSVLLLALGLLSTAIAQEPTVSLMPPINVNEGEIAQVCIEITDANLLDPVNPPTVMLATVESDTGPDFTPLSITVTLEIDATEGDKCYDVQTTDDDIVEPIELFEVVLSNAQRVSLGSPTSQIIGIIDDGDTIDVDFVSGELSGTEGNPIQACVVITRGGNQLAEDVNVVISPSDVTTSGVSDYAIIEATINIPVGAMTNDEYCTSIQLSSDGDIEPREETFTLSLAPLPGTFNPVNLADTVKTVTIIDGDRGNVNIISPLTIIEGNSSSQEFEIVIQLSPSIQAVLREVVYAVEVQDGSAVEGSDYTTTSTTEITFGVGSVGGDARIVSVDIIGDTTSELDETFTLNLIPSDPQSDDGLTQTFTIIDDEPQCEELTAPNNGNVDDSERYIGATATYTCDMAYELIGNSTRTCVEGPMWNNMEPRCALLLCPSPPELENGGYVEGSTAIGSVITYFCDLGYLFSTESTTRTCQNDQTWSMEDIMCEKVSRCPSPPELENGGYNMETSTNIVGSIVIYFCDNGYQFSTEATTRKCQDDQTWSTENIMCEKIPQTTSPTRDDDDDELSGGAIAGIVIAIVVAVVLLVVLLVLLIVCLILRKKNRSGEFKPSFETQDSPTRIQKTDIGEPVLVQDPEAGETVAESELNQSNEMLIN